MKFLLIFIISIEAYSQLRVESIGLSNASIGSGNYRGGGNDLRILASGYTTFKNNKLSLHLDSGFLYTKNRNSDGEIGSRQSGFVSLKPNFKIELGQNKSINLYLSGGYQEVLTNSQNSLRDYQGSVLAGLGIVFNSKDLGSELEFKKSVNQKGYEFLMSQFAKAGSRKRIWFYVDYLNRSDEFLKEERVELSLLFSVIKNKSNTETNFSFELGPSIQLSRFEHADLDLIDDEFIPTVGVKALIKLIGEESVYAF